MSVKRYEHYVDSDGGWEIGDAYSAMREEPDGDYVKAEDYNALAAEIESLHSRLAEARGCFDAALFEGWLDALANGDIERIRDLWTRRISFAMEAVTADSASAGREE